MDGSTHISDKLVAKLKNLPSVHGLAEDIKKVGRRVPDGWQVKTDDWQDLRRDYGLAPSRGFGDTIAKLTKTIGVKSCGGSKKRRRRLNKRLQYK